MVTSAIYIKKKYLEKQKMVDKENKILMMTCNKCRK